jgi:hypothetical protein
MKKLIALFALAAATLSAGAVGTSALTDPQLVTLRAGVCADNTARPLMQAGNGPGLNAWLNTGTATLGWRGDVTAAEMDEAPSMSTYDSLTQGKRDSWERLLDLRDGRTRDFNRGPVRNWVVDVWGTATAGSNSEKILLAGTQAATNAQLILGGTVKITGTVTATDRNYVGTVTTNETSRLIFQDNGQIYACP